MGAMFPAAKGAYATTEKVVRIPPSVFAAFCWLAYCMAVVGLMDAFRILLMGPIIDRVLNPNDAGAVAHLV